ncbi:MAG TPA: rhomboid family intramembrane serine protease [Phycisphaerae bacterium]|nr:rhomboid family intramembrane serine protease [Phycisphaerae bacterium]
MISFQCPQCGSVLRVADDKGGRKGRCPRCSSILRVPESAEPAPEPSGPHANDAALGAADDRPPRRAAAAPARPEPLRTDPLHPTAAGTFCPSCARPLPMDAKVCVDCGIYLPSGRPVLTARDVDRNELEGRVEQVLRPISWLIPFGLYPVYSEAPGRKKPWAVWVIAAATVLASVVFWSYEWRGAPQMQSLKNLMLWAGKAPASDEQIIAFYEYTSYGDSDAFVRKAEELEGTVPEDRLIRETYQALTPEQRSLGEFHLYQMVTSAFLHADIMHLAGNLVFLLVLGTRVNALVGNVWTALLYPLLAVLAAWAHMTAEAAGVPTPMLGASGAIMGLAGMYLVLFPLQRVYMAIWMRWGLIARFRLSIKIFAVRGVLLVLFYVAFDVIFTLVGAETGTAHWAHLGGIPFGLAAATALLTFRLVTSHADLVSLALGKYAWPLIGAPVSHGQHKGG